MLSALLSGCLLAPAPAPPNYYVIDYQQPGVEIGSSPAQPISEVVHVLDGRVNRTYERRQIVQRSGGPQITYRATDLWGVDLGVAMADLLADSLRERTLFEEIQRHHRVQRPDLEVYSELRVVEHICCNNIEPQARVAAVLLLRRQADQTVLVEHRFERFDPLPDNRIATFVLRVNTILLEEAVEFGDRVITYYQRS